MKKQILIWLIWCIGFSIAGNTCCAERNYRLLPLGQIKNNFVFLELNLFRHCNKNEGGGVNNEFWFAGTISLVKYKDDSLYSIKTFDKIDTLDCICKYQNHYELSTFDKILETYYKAAIRYAKKLKGYTPITTGSIHFNDTINTTVIENYTDSTYQTIVKYRNLFEVDLNNEDISSCHPTIVSEVRKYNGYDQDLLIIRLRCQPLTKKAIKTNSKKFKSIETAFWKEPAQWHGIAKDYLILIKK